jgi:hypothetical protein
MHAGFIFSEGGRTYDLIFPIINSPGAILIDNTTPG